MGSLRVGGREVNLSIWDTAGQEEYENIRKLTYPNTDIFLLCYSTVDRVSFENLRVKWLQELKAQQPGALKLLVGTMADRKQDKSASLPANRRASPPSKSDVTKLVR